MHYLFEVDSAAFSRYRSNNEQRKILPYLSLLAQWELLSSLKEHQWRTHRCRSFAFSPHQDRQQSRSAGRCTYKALQELLRSCPSSQEERWWCGSEKGVTERKTSKVEVVFLPDQASARAFQAVPSRIPTPTRSPASKRILTKQSQRLSARKLTFAQPIKSTSDLPQLLPVEQEFSLARPSTNGLPQDLIAYMALPSISLELNKQTLQLVIDKECDKHSWHEFFVRVIKWTDYRNTLLLHFFLYSTTVQNSTTNNTTGNRPNSGLWSVRRENWRPYR